MYFILGCLSVINPCQIFCSKWRCWSQKVKLYWYKRNWTPWNEWFQIIQQSLQVPYHPSFRHWHHQSFPVFIQHLSHQTNPLAYISTSKVRKKMNSLKSAGESYHKFFESYPLQHTAYFVPICLTQQHITITQYN